MKKNISRNPLWPDWYNGKKIDEVQFGRAFLEQWPLKCVNGTLYTLDKRKRQFRQLWIARINAAARINGLSYSKFMYGLKLAGVEMNRKVLSDMAINDAEGFAKLAELAKSKLA